MPQEHLYDVVLTVGCEDISVSPVNGMAYGHSMLCYSRSWCIVGG